jgi:hypothetical protein
VSASNNVDYALRLVDPSSVGVKASVGLGAIGNVGIPFRIPVPQTTIATGQFPLGLGTSGELRLPGATAPRPYSLKLTPVSFAANQAGLAGAWNADVQFR